MDEWMQFRRYLILGTTSSYYHVHTPNHGRIHDCIRILAHDGRAEDMIEEIVRVVDDRVAVCDKYAVRALAWMLCYAPHTRSMILWDTLHMVCRTWHSLIEFVHFMPPSWGRGTRRALERWLHRFDAKELAMQMLTKRSCKNRITPRNLLRLAHPRPLTMEHIELFSCLANNGWYGGDTTYLSDLDRIRRPWFVNLEEAIEVVKTHKMKWEHIGNAKLLREGALWNAMMGHVSQREILQNFHRIVGVHSVQWNILRARLTDRATMIHEHIQPLEVTHARHRIAEAEASTNAEVVADAESILEEVFYMSFDGLQTTSKRYLLALDVSGSMACSPCIGAPHMSAREASAVLAMCFTRSEPFVHTLAFSDHFRYLPIHRHNTLPEVLGHISHLSFDDTDCSALITHAYKNNIVVDCFVVITDGDLTHRIRPSQMLRDYQAKFNTNAKMVIVSSSSSEVYVASTMDDSMLDIVGINANVFPIIQRFVLGCV